VHVGGCFLCSIEPVTLVGMLIVQMCLTTDYITLNSIYLTLSHSLTHILFALFTCVHIM